MTIYPSKEECIKAIKDAGISIKVYNRELEKAYEKMSGFIHDKNAIACLVAKRLGAKIETPKTYLTGYDENNFTKISSILKTGYAGNSIYINVKGWIVKSYQNTTKIGEDYISIEIVDKSYKYHIRANLYNDSMESFKKAKAQFGDKIKLLSFKVKKLDTITILEGNKYSKVKKIITKH